MNKAQQNESLPQVAAAPNRATSRLQALLTNGTLNGGGGNGTLLQGQAASSAALGSIPSPTVSRIETVETQSSFGYSSFKLAIGESSEIRVPGRFLYIYAITVTATGVSLPGTVTAPVIVISPDQKGAIPIFASPSRYDGLKNFSSIRVDNTSGIAITVSLYVGEAENLLLPPSVNDTAIVAEMPPFFAAPALTLTRPANVTPYAAGQIVGNTATPALTVFSFSGVGRLVAVPMVTIRKLRLDKSTANVTNAAFRVYIFRISNALALADQTAYAPVFDDSSFQAVISVPAMTAEGGGAGAYGEVQNIAIPVLTNNSTITTGILYAIIVAEAAYVPGSAEQFTLRLWGDKY